ncbi:uncharacterized protein LOC122957005 [Acropora millepora]|uniref:uncharacterized protein LOC122957005 n=1 Tax=Acropora millepora TaxID=45264 RepID=UPI001CF5E939|nr:uncharacterized protein LOC122957005 [Acropora millepora]
MSKAEYKSLLFRISKRLDEINALEHILFICEEKLGHQTGQDIHNTLSLLRKLEETGSLGVDNLLVVKDLLRAVKEWGLREEINKFESTRRQYKEFVARVVSVLEELNDLERLMSIVARVRRIPEERRNDVQDVRSLVQVLEEMNFLGIDCLEILREILTELNDDELLSELIEFQKRRIEEETYEMRKARTGAVLSSASATIQRIIGEVRLRCTFRTLSGVVLLVNAGLILRRCFTFDDFAQAFTVAILPAANVLRSISDGSVYFMVRAETSLALEELYKRYSTGRLQRDLQEFLVTYDIQQLANGEEVLVSVYIDEEEYREALHDLKNVDQEGRDDIEEKQSRYLNEARMAFVQSYLESAEDTRSLTTGASDDGIGSHSTPSDLALEEPSGLCFKDLSKEIIGEFITRLRSDKVSCDQFYRSFGLENLEKKPYPDTAFEEIVNIDKLFPDTPIKLAIDVCRALQFYDLVELLEKAIKPRTLRPALPMTEITRSLSYGNRPTTFHSKVKIVFVGDGENTFVTMKNFFQKTCPGSEIYRIPLGIFHLESKERNLPVERNEIEEQLQELHVELTEKEDEERRYQSDEPTQKRFLPKSLTTGFERLQELRKRKNEIEEKLIKVNANLQKQMKKLEADTSRAVDDLWNEERDDESLFVVFCTNPATQYAGGFMTYHSYVAQVGTDSLGATLTGFQDRIKSIIMEKLASFPTTPKFLVTHISMSWMYLNLPETLHVEYVGSEGVEGTILEVLSKRWRTLDLISIMKEVQRTLSMQKNSNGTIKKITDNLSAVPRFHQTTEEQS